MGQKRNVHWFLVRKPEGKRLLRRPVSRWENNKI
jgi:hypothetical protein